MGAIREHISIDSKDANYIKNPGLLQIGVFASAAAGSGIKMNTSKTAALRVYGDDGGAVAWAVGSVPDQRAILGRQLLTVDQTGGNLRSWGVMGQFKSYDAKWNNEQVGGVNGRLEVVQASGTITLGGNGISAGVCGIFATAGTLTVNTNHVVAGLAAIADIKGTVTQTGKVVGVYVGKYDTTNWSDATARANWGYGLYVDEDAITVCPIQVGKFVASAAAGGGFAVTATNSAAMRVYGEVTSDLTSAAMVRSILGRMLVTGAITSNAEVFGTVGQLVAKAATLAHDNAGVLGTFEAQGTAVTVSGTGGDNCTAAVLGRVGVAVTATTVNATGVLAGVAAMSNITSGYVTIDSGGILAGVYVGAFSSKQSWAYGIYATSCLKAAYFNCDHGAITGEEHSLDLATTGTLSSGDSLVGVNVVATALGSAATWVSGLYVKAVQASKVVNGYICAAELELASVAANAADHACLVLNMNNNHTGSVPVSPYIMLREYGTTKADCFVRIYNDAGQSGTTDATKLITTVSDNYELNCNYAIRCMLGSTPIWLLATSSAAS